MTSSEIILKNGIRILMPSQYEAMRSVMVSPDSKNVLAAALESGDTTKAERIQRYPTICDAMLMTGMRYVEFCGMARFWYSGPRRVLQIPMSACSKGSGKKGRKVYTERTVMLSLPACDAVERFLAYRQHGLGIPKLSAMHEALNNYAKWSGIGNQGITTKMFRKTWVSWLTYAFPDQLVFISASMGHSIPVLQKHYLGVMGTLDAEESEKLYMYTAEWGKRL